jgi:hypothetical protein
LDLKSIGITKKKIEWFCPIKWHAVCSGGGNRKQQRRHNIYQPERRIQQMPVVKRLALILATLWLSAQTALAAGGGGAPIVMVADTRKLSGIMAWWANLYNESHVYFTILTIILIPLVGVIFGVLADIIMHFIGIDLKSRELAEH